MLNSRRSAIQDSEMIKQWVLISTWMQFQSLPLTEDQTNQRIYESSNNDDDDDGEKGEEERQWKIGKDQVSRSQFTCNLLQFRRPKQRRLPLRFQSFSRFQHDPRLHPEGNSKVRLIANEMRKLKIFSEV